MKKLNILLATAVVFSSAAICAKKVKTAEVCKAVVVCKTLEAKKVVTINKYSKCNKFLGEMTVTGKTTTFTVKNVETKELVLNLSFEKQAKSFTFKKDKKDNETVTVYFRKGFKSETYTLTPKKCKNCGKQLDAAVGVLAKVKVLGIPVPNKKK